MKKTILVVICGKSASGKDSLANYLQITQPFPVKVNRLLSETTRPPRASKQFNREYNFVSEDTYAYKADGGFYLDYATFNNWGYGTDASQLISGQINVLVTSPKGLEQVYKNENKYNLFILPFYLKCSLLTRLERSYSREQNYFKIEFLRRAFADFLDFRKLKKNFPEVIVIPTDNGKESYNLKRQMKIIGKELADYEYYI